MKAIYRKVLRECGPDALRLYRIIERQTDSRGVFQVDIKELTRLYNDQLRREALAATRRPSCGRE